MNKRIIQKITKAFEQDPDLLVTREQLQTTLGHNPAYLEEILGITKSDLLRLSRRGLALKAVYPTVAGVRVRWFLFKEILE